MSTNYAATRLENGGLYVLLFLRQDRGTFHWGLYLHRHTTASAPDKQGVVKYVPHGIKYHIQNVGRDGQWMADHGQTRGVLKSMFLIVLVRIGLIQEENFDALDMIIRRRDSSLNSTPTTCRVWTMAIIHDLCVANHLSLQRSLQDVENEIRYYGNFEWDAAMENYQPRPIVVSQCFDPTFWG